jgi:CelD/BcsL family acetyltransferase involved in cellulose biosynthesis
MTVQNAKIATHGESAIVRIEVSQSLDRFRQWWPTTGALGEARCYPFQCADVLRVWCDTIGRARDVEPVFVAAFDAYDEPLLLLPLGIYSSNGTRVLRFLDGGVSDYNAPVVFPATENIAARDIHAFWDSLQRRLDSVDLIVL